MTEWLGSWIGWGWGGTGVIWLMGSAFILFVVDKMFRSRLTTAVVMVVWTVLLLAAAAKLFGMKPPSG